MEVEEDDEGEFREQEFPEHNTLVGEMSKKIPQVTMKGRVIWKQIVQVGNKLKCKLNRIDIYRCNRKKVLKIIIIIHTHQALISLSFIQFLEEVYSVRQMSAQE